jgi:flagellar basal-body rod protein FlgF
MDRMLYVAMTGAKETLLAQGAVNHNMANASTTGFLADLQQFRSMPVFGAGHPTRVYAMSERPETDRTPGTMDRTGRDLDVAVKGGGWIAVQGPDGREAYTRRGDLEVDVNGRLTNGEGLPVMGNSGPIALPPFDKIEIGADGTVSIRPKGELGDALAQVDRIRLVKTPEGGLQKGLDGLMRPKDGQPLPADADQRLVNGALVASNVDMVGEMVHMIELSRRFELQVQMMKTAEQTASSSSTLLRPV